MDVLYLDPPYNTGDKDWAYNNDFMGKSDVFRPSKWLAFMERRLILGRRLLKPDGIVVVAIDENEHAHLVMLMEQIFIGYDITSVAIVHNPRGVQGDNFSYTNEFAVFAVPGKGLINPRKIAVEDRDTSELRDHGGESLRTDARTCFYPILVRDGKIVGYGDIPADDFHPKGTNVALADGVIEIWPIDVAGVERKWRYSRWTVEGIADWLSVSEVGRAKDRRWNIYITKPTGTHRTVWSGPRYDSGVFGTRLISVFADARFTFPKSLYNTHDVLDAAVGNRPDAVILDFFGGSGTTLHATMLLNSEDQGRRRCVIVTNNEVNYKIASALNDKGLFRGDPDFEAAGVYESATRPRAIAAVTGKRPNGDPVPGDYLDSGRPHADGFPENVEFFRLKYLDPMLVEMGRSFADLHPLLWLAAGGVGKIEELDPAARYAVPTGSHYAVLFHPAGVPKLLAALKSRSDVRRVFIAAHSDSSFSELASVMPVGVEAVHFQQKFIETLRGAVL